VRVHETGSSPAFRSRDSFPTGPHSKIRPLIDELKADGFTFVDMPAGEMVTLLQLRKLASRVDSQPLARWLEKRLLPLPALAALLAA